MNLLEWMFPSGNILTINVQVLITVLVLAAVIAFSRLYLYAHWPTDILGGILVGTLAGWLGAKLVQLLAKKGEKN